MKKILLLVNTIKYLKLQQIIHKIIKIFIKSNTFNLSTFDGRMPLRSKNWHHIELYSPKIDNDFNACFLNQSKLLNLPSDWNDEFPSKLWLYNLHYFEDLLSSDAHKKHDFHLKLLKFWIDDNKLGFGNGWEPYPTSLRIVNILKAWLGGLELDEKLFSNVFTQASFLSSNLEKHLLGNHYFVNLKALLFAGVIFENIQWLRIAEEGLFCEIPEQILEDGANFELSPMYHSLMLVDMLDMLNLSKAYPSQVSSKLVSLLEDYIPKMLFFMEAMAHPDGGVSFFNDSSDGIAPTKLKIESYASKLGFEINLFDSSNNQIIDNASSGYICALRDGNKLIFDAAAVGPDYIPGHAHADTLSFEFSIGHERVFVNSGTSEYGLSQKRLHQRKTASHNTVEVDSKDSSQVWSGFRVGRRAKIIEKTQVLNCDRGIHLTAAHNGYKSIFFGCIHKREIYLNEKNLVIMDKLSGKFARAKSRFHFHPELKVTLKHDILTVVGRAFHLNSNLKDKNAQLIDSFWHPQFGIDMPNKVLVIDVSIKETEIIFKWSKSHSDG